jgi:hypothetical protein
MAAILITRDGTGETDQSMNALYRNVEALADFAQGLEAGTPGVNLTRAALSTPAAAKAVGASIASIATTGNSDTYIIVPEAGTISSIDCVGEDALAASDTNYITFSVTNLGLAGSGTAVVLAATNANTTRTTGGSAIVALGRRALTLTGTAADLVVAQGNVLRIRAAATGTLANVVAPAAFLVRFAGTT